VNSPNHAAVTTLLVDDDAELLAILQEALGTSRVAAFQIATAQTLEEALRRIGQGGLDAIVLDLTLPDCRGYDTFRRVHTAAPELPIVVLSGTDDEALAMRMVQEGAQDYLIKGETDMTVLARTIRYAVERKNAEKAIEAERNLLRNVINSLPDGIYVKDTEGRYVVDNDAHTRFLGAEREEDVIGRTASDFYPPDQAAEIIADDREVMQSGEPVLDRLEFIRLGWRLRSKVPLRDVQGSVIGLLGVGRDVTQQKVAEELLRESQAQMRALAARLQTDREEFKERIARELHDQIGQFLTALKMDLVRLARNPPQAPEALTERASSMAELVDTCIELVRGICSELRPRLLDDLGLIAALEWQAKEFQKRSGITCEFYSPTSLDLDSARSTALFRVAQEALTNVVRHAQASRVQLTLKAGDHSIELELYDNGRGITQEEAQRRDSLGLLGMRERVQPFDGEFEISGAPGQGTMVRVRVPCVDESK
jgi:two-component system sensor histidine kinase UhpB